MGEFNSKTNGKDIAGQPIPSDIRITPIVLSKQAWESYFDLRFWPDYWDDNFWGFATVGVCHIPAEYAALDGIYEAQCVRTREKLVLLGYLFKNGGTHQCGRPSGYYQCRKRVMDDFSGVWLAMHKHSTGSQFAIFYDPEPRFIGKAEKKVRLDTREDWEEFKKKSLPEMVKALGWN